MRRAGARSRRPRGDADIANVLSQAVARYGLLTLETMDMVVASVDQLLETLDPDEFETAMWCVAYAADSYEQEFGQDQF